MSSVELPHWVEVDGTEVWLVGGVGDGRIPDLEELEAEARRRASAGAVLGANADAGDRVRVEQLVAAGYSRVFSVVRLTRDLQSGTPHPRPELMVRAARAGDAEAMHRLTEAVWRGRDWFVLPTLADYEAWVARSDLSLFLLDDEGGCLRGYVAGEARGSVLWIDDVQVHPDHRRRGIATELISRLLDAAASRGLTRAELTTEGGDPSGARTLYQSLGFTLMDEALRFRRSVADRSTP